ncbi:Pyrogallol hydroxytransferase large subunit [Desulfitobacterium hafniense]|uniref:Pyrogallol hydroxytransferase large subunit n=1 Tax=Desulfitobacterium hafniense TaxID=49338 RepID=A0A098B4H0_DESHA|nr:molybdopterin-dependent oxidoreductase [Desulfitobacterium hafniense]CDX03734.1 Pyrogallol hydroxytransferase large subunit [Desulfitobacterium hafniense]
MSKKDKKTCIKGIGLCGFGSGSNSAAVDVQDGKVVRIRNFRYDEKYTPEEMKPWRLQVNDKIFEPTMKSLLPPYSMIYKKRTYSKNRIPYPMKRVDWDPEGERNPQNRGISKFVRISWDEAAELIAKELKRVYKEYGPYTVLAQGDGHGETKTVHAAHGCQMKLLDFLGGYTLQARNADSWEGWYWGAKHVWGQDPVGQGKQTNLFKDISENSKMVLFWGCDPETTPWGWGGQQASRLSYWFTDIGIKSVYICPDLNYGAAVHADKWIPVLPNTDLAMQFAIAYIWLTEDSYDKEYIETHTIGFDYLKRHALGEDGTEPKTPEWAEKICGVPARTIKALARKWAKEATTIAHSNGGSYIRSCYSHEPARMEVCLLAMQGLGKPGRNQFKFIEWQLFGSNEQMPAPRSEFIPTVKSAYTGWRYTMSPQFLPKTLIPKAIQSDEPLTWYGQTMAGYPREDQFIEYQYPIEGGAPIHMIWTDTPCWTTCWTGGNEMIEALRNSKIECIVAQHPWLENDCLFADIILPTSTKMESRDISVDTLSGNFNHLFYEEQCIEPVGEAKSDWEAVCEVAQKLGLLEQYTDGMSEMDLIKKGFMESGVQTKISFEEFLAKGYYMIPTADGWEDDIPGFGKFYQDPKQYPLETPSGLLEIFSQDLADVFPDDQERKPYPQWIAFGESHSESLLHPKSEKYPYLIVSNHPRWRVHANLDDISWLREIPTCKVAGPDGYLYEPVWINPVDAEKHGIQSGDVVKLFNDNGWVLGGAYVTERIRPGAIYQDHGARLDPIKAGEGDRGGANNLICVSNTVSKHCAGEVTSGFLINIEKCDLDALKAEYPEAFNREYDPGTGVCLSSWIVGGAE